MPPSSLEIILPHRLPHLEGGLPPPPGLVWPRAWWEEVLFSGPVWGSEAARLLGGGEPEDGARATVSGVQRAHGRRPAVWEGAPQPSRLLSGWSLAEVKERCKQQRVAYKHTLGRLSRKNRLRGKVSLLTKDVDLLPPP